MCEHLSHMKDITVAKPVVTLRSAMNAASEQQIEALAETLTA